MRLADALSALCSLAAQISQSQDMAQFSLSHGWTLDLVELSDLLVGLVANGVSWRRQNVQLLAATAKASRDTGKCNRCSPMQTG
jgi:hypothetical protein